MGKEDDAPNHFILCWELESEDELPNLMLSTYEHSMRAHYLGFLCCLYVFLYVHHSVWLTVETYRLLNS